MTVGMDMSDTNLVLISGPVGVGKTTLGEELSGTLESAGVAHTFVDLDGLSKTYPRPEDDRFGEKIALKNLGAIWTHAFEQGVRNLIVARVIETHEGAKRIEQAVSARRSVVIELGASDETLLGRVRKREIGTGRAWHERRALELSGLLKRSGIADVSVDTDRKSVQTIANELHQQIGWL